MKLLMLIVMAALVLAETLNVEWPKDERTPYLDVKWYGKKPDSVRCTKDETKWEEARWEHVYSLGRVRIFHAPSGTWKRCRIVGKE